MPENALNLDRVIDSMKGPIRKYGERVQELAGAKALAVTLFGAIAAGTFDSSRHTVRSVLVFQDVDLELLRQFAKEGTKLGKARIAAPLVMTPEYIKSSVDSFPLEFIEFQQCHLCLFGPDYFSDLVFEPTHVRLQSEREVKTILIGMRQALLAAAGKEKLFGDIEADVAERLIRILRGLLWLHEQNEALPAEEVVTQVEREVKRGFPGLRSVLHKEGPHQWDQFKGLYEDVDALRNIIETW
ncbi:MAG: hypothetical protein VST68_01220 [Nitrospirota bacterium]|nr:hypothetical protein [Nitrospirota bacterium]